MNQDLLKTRTLEGEGYTLVYYTHLPVTKSLGNFIDCASQLAGIFEAGFADALPGT